MTIEVVQAAGLCTVQDLGRRRHMHEAVPPGGALVRELLVAANRRAGNRDDAPGIEVLGRLVVRATATIEIATSHVGPTELLDRDEHIVESAPLRVTYLAVRGGFDVPRVIDGRGTLLCAGLGKRIARGDVLRVGDELESNATRGERFIDTFEPSDLITVIGGPDLDAFDATALDELERATFRISPTSDRVGTRLEPIDARVATIERVAGYRERSRPMVIGALEVPRDGQPIVLGPEHPTTGGYPILAVIANAELGRFFAIRLGGTVRFRVAR